MRARTRNFQRLVSLLSPRGRALLPRAVSHKESRSLMIVGMIIGCLNSMRIIVGTIMGNTVGFTDIVQEGTIAVPIGVETMGDIVPRGTILMCLIEMAVTQEAEERRSNGAPRMRGGGSMMTIGGIMETIVAIEEWEIVETEDSRIVETEEWEIVPS